MELINEIETVFNDQIFQKEAAIDALNSEYRKAVIKMIGCYYRFDLESIDGDIFYQYVPNWLVYPACYPSKNVHPIGSEYLRCHLSQLNENCLIASEILNGDFGLAMQTMSIMTFSKYLDEWPEDHDFHGVRSIVDISHPWTDVVSQMQPQIHECGKLIIQND